MSDKWQEVVVINFIFYPVGSIITSSPELDPLDSEIILDFESDECVTDIYEYLKPMDDFRKDSETYYSPHRCPNFLDSYKICKPIVTIDAKDGVISTCGDNSYMGITIENVGDAETLENTEPQILAIAKNHPSFSKVKERFAEYTQLSSKESVGIKDEIMPVQIEIPIVFECSVHKNCYDNDEYPEVDCDPVGYLDTQKISSIVILLQTSNIQS